MKNIDKEIEKTLSSFDDVIDIKAKPYFFTRLSAKIDFGKTQLASNLRWGIAAIVVVILVNLISMLSLPSEIEEDFDPIEMMASEYSLMENNIYNTNLEEQP